MKPKEKYYETISLCSYSVALSGCCKCKCKSNSWPFFFDNGIKGSDIKRVAVYCGGRTGPSFMVLSKGEHAYAEYGFQYPLTESNIEKFSKLENQDISHRLKNKPCCDIPLGDMRLFSKITFQYDDQKGLTQANKLPLVISSEKYASEETKFVMQGDALITTKESETPILATFGAGPCIILAAYSPVKGVALLAHMDMRDSIDTTFIKISNYFSDSEVYFYLMGGDSSDTSKEHALYILSLIDQNKKYILKGARLKTDTIDSLAIDARTGVLLDVPLQMAQNANLDALRARLEL